MKKKKLTNCEVLLNYLAWTNKYLEQVEGLTCSEVETLEKNIDKLKTGIQYKKMLI